MVTNLGRIEVGEGIVEVDGDRATLHLPRAHNQHYSDAQLDDTHRIARSQYLWNPPLQLALDARFSHPAGELLGTAGFGFWNVPFGPGRARLPALPRAVWFFFGSPPHNVPLVLDVPGFGWKASCLDASRASALLLAPLAPIAVLMMQSNTIYRRLWPRVQKALGVTEMALQLDMSLWHHYEIDWQPTGVDFRIDGELLLRAPSSPRGPLGFVAWIDNQYAIATPRGRFGWGLLNILHAQWLELANLNIEPPCATGFLGNESIPGLSGLP